MSVHSTVNSPSIGCRLPRLVLVSKTLGAGPRRNHTLNRDVPCKDGASYRRPLHRSPFIETLGFYSAPLLLLPLATQSPDRDDRYVFHGRCAQRSPISQFDSVAFAEHTISLRLNGRVNKLRGTLQCAAVKSPGFSDRRVATLEDSAIVTGGRFFSRDIGVPLSSVRIEDLGTAKRVQITKDRTAIFDGGGKPDVVAQRAQGHRREIQSTLFDFDKAKLQERLANIAGGIAVIRTGGLIFQEVIDEQYRVQSALHSVFSATEEGWIPGGGISLFNAARSLETLTGGSEGANAGIGIMRTALEAPIRALIATTNESPIKVLTQLKEAQEPSVGYNVQTSGVENLAKAGIIDPVKSVRLAVTLAVAHAKAVLQTGAWELEEVEKTKTR
jgi:chaperonin GroEL (HSP60 family)